MKLTACLTCCFAQFDSDQYGPPQSRRARFSQMLSQRAASYARSPARASHLACADDCVELVAVRDEVPPSVGGYEGRLRHHLDAAEMRSGVGAHHLVVVAGNDDDPGAGLGLGEEGLDHVVVRLRPVPAAPDPPAVEDIAHEVVGVGFVATEEVEQQVRLASRRSEMDVRQEYCAVFHQVSRHSCFGAWNIGRTGDRIVKDASPLCDRAAGSAKGQSGTLSMPEPPQGWHAADAPQGQPSAAERAVPLQRLQRIGRAGGLVAAAVADPGRQDQPVGRGPAGRGPRRAGSWRGVAAMHRGEGAAQLRAGRGEVARRSRPRGRSGRSPSRAGRPRAGPAGRPRAGAAWRGCARRRCRPSLSR